jgi:hypothetical protein
VEPVAGGQLAAGPIAKQAAPAPGAAAGAAPTSAGDESVPAARPGPARVDHDDTPATRAVGDPSPLRSPAPAANAGAAAAPSRAEEGDPAPRRSAAPAPQTTSGAATSRLPRRHQAAPRDAETAPGTGQNATALIPAGAAPQVAAQPAPATAAKASDVAQTAESVTRRDPAPRRGLASGRGPEPAPPQSAPLWHAARQGAPAARVGAALGDPMSLAERSIAASRPLSGARRLGAPTLRASSPRRPESPADEPLQPWPGRPELQASGPEMPGAAAAPVGRTRLVPRPHASPAARPRSTATADKTNSVNRSRSSASDGSVTPPPAAATAIPKPAIATMPAPSSPPTPPSAGPRAAVVQRARFEPRLVASERTTEYEFDQLADRLYGRISARLRGELRIDRERLGLAADLR